MPTFDPEWAASLRAEMDRCAKCGQCRSICPVFAETGDEGDVARGRISLLEALLDGRIGYTERLQESLTKCLDCLRCDADCPSGVAHELIVQAARQGMAREMRPPWPARFAFRHVLPRRRLFDLALRAGAWLQRLSPPRQEKDLRNLPLFLAGHGRIPRLAPKTAPQMFRQLSSQRPRNPSSVLGAREAARLRHGKKPLNDQQFLQKGRVAIFTGCLIHAVYPEVAVDLAAVLARIGFEPVLPPGQVCCGAPLLSCGEVESARRIAGINRRVLAASGADTVLTPCAACGHTLKSAYPRLLSEDWTGGKFRVLDACEFLSRQDLGPLAPLPETVAYHDPCQLRWGQKVAEEPRELLRRCSRYVEMPGAERCCGGGAFSLFHADIAGKIADRKVRSIRQSGAQTVATACPGCMLLLRDRLAAASCAAGPVHVVTVLRRAMGDA